MLSLSPCLATYGRRTRSGRHGWRWAMTPWRCRGWRCNLEPIDAHFTTKIRQQSNIETHKTEGILEGEILPRCVLGICGCHDNTGERTVIPPQAEYSCSSGIIIFRILMAMQNKWEWYLFGHSTTSSGSCLTSYSMWMIGKDGRKTFPKGNYHLSRCAQLMCILSYRSKNDAIKQSGSQLPRPKISTGRDPTGHCTSIEYDVLAMECESPVLLSENVEVWCVIFSGSE